MARQKTAAQISAERYPHGERTGAVVTVLARSFILAYMKSRKPNLEPRRQDADGSQMTFEVGTTGMQVVLNADGTWWATAIVEV